MENRHVAKYLQQVSKEVGADIKITGFVRFETGEGLEKKNEDFAAEVAAQMKRISTSAKSDGGTTARP